MRKLCVLVICSFMALPAFAQSDYKGFVAFHGGASFTPQQFDDLSQVFSLSYGGLISRRSYVGSFEIIAKAFLRDQIPLSLGLKYAYSFLGSGDLELGLDISAFVQGLKGSSVVVSLGNELGLFISKFIANKVSIGLRSGYYVRNFNFQDNGYLYLEGAVKWYFL